MEKIIIGSDGSGYTLKEAVKAHLIERGFDVKDVGTTAETPVDYFDAAANVAGAVSSGEYERGIVICGTGMGVNLMANRFPGVLCGLCESVHTVEHARKINNINILAMGGWFQGPELGCMMTDAFLDTAWKQGLDEETAALVQKGYDVTLAKEKEVRG